MELPHSRHCHQWLKVVTVVSLSFGKPGGHVIHVYLNKYRPSSVRISNGIPIVS